MRVISPNRQKAFRVSRSLRLAGEWSTSKHLIGTSDLSEFAEVPVDIDEPRFIYPLKQSVQSMPGIDSSEVILLGSVATGKYTDTLLPILGERLLFPAEFAGRGDMSRGALLLRCVATNTELSYLPLSGARRSAAVGIRRR